MTRPAPTVTVPPKALEAIAFNLCSLHDFDPAFVQQNERFAIAAITEYLRATPAPAAPQAAGVGEDERPLGAAENGSVLLDQIEHNYSFACEGGELKNCAEWHEARRCFEALADFARHASLRAPVREEGGAVSEGELRDAIALMLPLAKGYAAAHPVGSNQAYVDYVEGLVATRHEAPAEAGERETLRVRAQPQAREEAQPVGWRVRRWSEDPEEWQLRPAGAALDYADGRLWEIQPLYTTPPAPDEIKAAYQRGWGDRESDIIERAERIAPQPDALAVLDRLLTHSGARGTFDAMKHGDAVKDAEALIASSPAPDALRVAVEALEPFAKGGHYRTMPGLSPSYTVADFGDGVVVTVADFRRAAEAFAALQAEQKGGAA